MKALIYATSTKHKGNAKLTSVRLECSISVRPRLMEMLDNDSNSE